MRGNPVGSVEVKAFNEHYLPPFTTVCISWSVYHIAYFTTYFRCLCFTTMSAVYLQAPILTAV